MAFVVASTSPSNCNIASMEMQTQMHGMVLNPFLTFYIEAMLNVDANANVKCKQTFTFVQLYSINVYKVGRSFRIRFSAKN